MQHLPKLFALIPAGIGLTLFIWLWMQPFGAFHSPPLFFRIMGSFVAAFFMLFGVAVFAGSSAMSGTLKDRLRALKRMQQELEDELPEAGQSDKKTGSYHCSSCGAPLGEGAEVSPHGDVKCTHCGKWFNIHQS